MSKVLVLASYCGAEDQNGCTDINPCAECLEMCNVFEADLTKADFIAQLDNLRRGLGKYPRAVTRPNLCTGSDDVGGSNGG
jgi:hypothetical protein